MVGRLTLLAAKLRGVHRLTEHLDREATCLLQIAILLVVLLEETLRGSIVCSDTGRLPAAVVAARVALVKLELSLGVPSCIDERHTEGPETTMLGVALLQVA